MSPLLSLFGLPWRSSAPRAMSFVVAGVLTSACASAPPPLPEPTSLAPTTPKVPSPAERFATATSAFEAGDYAAAIANYDAILANDPRNAGVLYNRALALHRSGDYERAQTAYAATLKANPSDLDAAINLGAVKKEIGDTAGAIALYRRVLAKDEFNPKLLNNLAALYRADGQHTKAIKTIRKLLMRDKNNVDAYKNLALVYFDQKKYRLTQTILDNALQMARTQNRAEPDIFVNMGRMFLATNKNGRAMAAFKRAVALAPNHAVANYNMGALALGHRDYRMAAQAYAVCTKAWPEKYDVWASLGYAHQGLQEFKVAEQHLAKSRALLFQQAKAVTRAPLRRRLAQEDEQLLFQLVSTAQGAAQNQKALGYAEEYIKLKGLSCSEEDYDGFCGRYNGIKLTLQMEKEAQEAPEPEAPKKALNVEDSTILTDGEADGAALEGQAGAPEASDLPPK